MINTEGKIMKVCLKCGEIAAGNANSTTHSKCGGKLQNTNYTLDYFLNELPSSEERSFYKMLRERYVLTPSNTEFDEDAYYAREDEVYRADIARNKMLGKYDQYTQASDPNACPHCGNTSFTPVKRKWSIWTGFRTEKVDMVCNKCGYVKKG